MRPASDRIWSTIANNHQTHNPNHIHHPPASTSKQPVAHGSNQSTDTIESIHPTGNHPRHGHTSPITNADWVAGYAQMISDRVRDGWSCYLVTFMFDQLPGSPTTVMAQMKDQVQRVYSTLVTRTHRKPRNASPDELPILVGFLDRQVYKRDRSSAPSARCNDGLHFHALVLLPPSSRLKGSLVDHLRENERLYVRPGKPVQRIHAELVTAHHERVVDYTLKTVSRGRLSYEDAVLVLPRSRSELEVN
jgi:hypothetical protein